MKKSKDHPYHVPPGYKGFWLDEKTFVVIKEDQSEEYARTKFAERKGVGWQLGYAEQYSYKPRKRNGRSDY